MEFLYSLPPSLSSHSIKDIQYTPMLAVQVWGPFSANQTGHPYTSSIDGPTERSTALYALQKSQCLFLKCSQSFALSSLGKTNWQSRPSSFIQTANQSSKQSILTSHQLYQIIIYFYLYFSSLQPNEYSLIVITFREYSMWRLMHYPEPHINPILTHLTHICIQISSLCLLFLLSSQTESIRPQSQTIHWRA